MKKSVNGKSFDEIFEQRGKEILHPYAGRIYFAFFHENCDLNSIVQVYKVQKKESDFFTSFILWVDGDFWLKQKTSFGSDPKLYEATPDQIDLLNLYKSEQ